MRDEVRFGVGEELRREVIGACIEVHRNLGPGLLESIYETCVCHEMGLRGIAFERQKPLPVLYKGLELDQGYRLDLFVEGALVLEIKAVESLTAIHTAQVLTYLKPTRSRIGLLMNFNEPVLKAGIRKIIL